ncbi:MAG TPA: flavin reductase family protein [Polyangiaceae bacterium]|jgi:flavin reductase ActVB|nr:flavin reductase family protein [Polyangiaceae bacterium]
MTEPITAAAFREALSQFASGVTIVAVHHPSGPVGFTATGFSSVSLSPPLVLVCIDKEASAYSGVVGADYFGVSILDDRQAWVALQFARSGIDRFSGVPLRTAKAGRAPLIDGALAHLECRKHSCIEAGDHAILLGEVLEGVVGVGRPLLHFARRFGSFVAEAQDQKKLVGQS